MVARVVRGGGGVGETGGVGSVGVAIGGRRGGALCSGPVAGGGGRVCRWCVAERRSPVAGRRCGAGRGSVSGVGSGSAGARSGFLGRVCRYVMVSSPGPAPVGRAWRRWSTGVGPSSAATRPAGRGAALGLRVRSAVGRRRPLRDSPGVGAGSVRSATVRRGGAAARFGDGSRPERVPVPDAGHDGDGDGGRRIRNGARTR